MKIVDLVKYGSDKLKKIDKNSSQFISEIFLSKILCKSREWIISHYDFEVKDRNILEKFYSFIERRLKREPFEYIIGKKEFFSCEIKLTEDVLIPRAETEILVEKAVEIIKKDNLKKIIDIGTGSGAIAKAIKNEIPEVKVVATDISYKALKVAKKNFYNLDILVVCCDLLESIKGKFDMIISNPPYIKSLDLNKLPKEVKDFEPKIALDGGIDGLKFYRKIISQGKEILSYGGYILFEIGYISHVNKIKEIFLKNGFYSFEVVNDYSNFPRVVLAKKI